MAGPCTPSAPPSIHLTVIKYPSLHMKCRFGVGVDDVLALRVRQPMQKLGTKQVWDGVWGWGRGRGKFAKNVSFFL